MNGNVRGQADEFVADHTVNNASGRANDQIARHRRMKSDIATKSIVAVRLPRKIRTRGRRKPIVAPDGAAWVARRPRVNNAMIKALARAHRWKRLLEMGKFGSLTELATAENINLSTSGASCG